MLKCQHHGSDKNFTQDFFERVTADRYVFSGNGRHGNPERATLDMLRKARSGAEYTIYLTYEVDVIDALRKREQGLDWVHAEHSLVAFFEQYPDMKPRIATPIGDLPRHRINLLTDPDDPTDGEGTG